ncbi:MAG: type I 3-dehydroquinate dehydratase [Lentisphaerae bacterium]|nr:type I 3-dehydroquinate dehydratase [Lentisphaerota bacterium]
MRAYCLNDVELGSLPRVVGTVTCAERLESAWSAHDTPCNIVEVRLDQIGVEHPAWLPSCLAIEAAGLPVILTLRMKEEGGKWLDDEAMRGPILASALDALAGIDIEWASSLRKELCDQAVTLKKPILVSFHDFNKTPDIERLRSIVAEICDCPCAIPKVSTFINEEQDVRALRTLLDGIADRPSCVIGMGSKGTKTRIEFPLAGSGLTYGFLDASNAPGQLSAAELFDSLRKQVPAYDQEAIIHKQML